MRAPDKPNDPGPGRPTPGERASPQEVMSSLGQRAREQVSRALEWLPRPAEADTGGIRSPRLDRDSMLKSLSERYSYPIIEEGQDGQRFSKELVVGHDPFGEAAEAIRSIRSEVASAALGQGKRSILVVAPRADTGTTYLAGNLAVAFAQMGIPTLLIDANLRKPRVAQLFGIPPERDGLVELVVRKNRDPSPINYNVMQNLSVLTAGAVPPNPQELLAAPEFLALTNTFQNHFGVVLYDTAPGLDYADALVVGSRVGSAIMVARQHRTNWQDASALAKKLASIQCALVGSVLNTY